MSCNPASLTSVPEGRYLPDSRIMSIGYFYIDGLKMERCPQLKLSRGDTYGVSWEPGKVIRYYNGAINYVWDVKLPDSKPIWGMTDVRNLDHVSIVNTASGRTTYDHYI